MTEPRFSFACYGTLRPGCGNDRLWQGFASSSSAELHGYRLVSTGGFPYCIPDGHAVTAIDLVLPDEDFYVQLRDRMDALEGTPHHYQRTAVAVHSADATSTAWLYVPAPATLTRVLALPDVERNADGRYDWTTAALARW